MSPRSPILRRALVVLALAVISHAPRAQCLEWTNTADLPGLTVALSNYAAQVNALTTLDDGSGNALYAGGSFADAGGVAVRGVAKWDGTAWSAVDPHAEQIITVSALCPFGSELFVAGTRGGPSFPPIAFVSRCIGSSPGSIGHFWTSEEFDTQIYALEEFNGSLFVAGRFNGVISVLPARSIASWDGSTWDDVGGGCDYTSAIFWKDANVLDLAVFDDGGGAQLYAAGDFFRAGTVSTVHGLARWDGASWSHPGPAPSDATWWYSLAVFDDGQGRALYGSVRRPGGESIMRFDGSAWTTIATASHTVWELAVFDDGSGPALYAGGQFNSIGGVAANHIAKWNGTSWSAIGAGVGVVTNGGAFNSQHSVYALESFDNGSGAALYVGGRFPLAGGDQANNIAAWQPCNAVGTPYCFGDGSLATPCPCGPPYTVPSPSGAADSGCANSAHASGATLFASGTTNPDTVTLHTMHETQVGFTIFIAGNGTEAGGVAYHDGVRCAGGSFVRFGAQYATAGTTVYPNSLLGQTNTVSFMSSAAPGSGQTRYYQALYRDAAPTFCGPGTLNLSNAVEIVW